MDVLNANAEIRPVISNTLADRPRSDSRSSDKTLLNMSDSDNEEKRRGGDLEKDGIDSVLPKVITKDHVTKDPLARVKLLMWMVTNTLSTVLIVRCPVYPIPGIRTIMRSTRA